MPTRMLPASPSLAHLKNQAQDLLRVHAAATDPRVFQRLREFHPRLAGLSDDAIARATLRLSDAQLAIAREYGFESWPKLKAFVESGAAPTLQLPAHERIVGAEFRRAVDLLDAGDVEGLREHLRRYPRVARQRVSLPGGNYFNNPGLLEFIAENPTRHGRLPSNVADCARVILDAGAREDAEGLREALVLVASSLTARTCGVQKPLIDVLCEYGADPQSALGVAAMYNEFDAIDALLRNGAALTLVAAASLGRDDDVRRLAFGPGVSADERSAALALAAQFGHIGAVRILLDAGADAAGYTPKGGHSHGTPLHQAALSNNREIALLLIAHGARLDRCDTLYGGTPAGWAEYAGHHELAEELRGFDKLSRPSTGSG